MTECGTIGHRPTRVVAILIASFFWLIPKSHIP